MLRSWKCKSRGQCISSTQRCHDQRFPVNNCNDVKTFLPAFNDEFRNLFFIDVHEILLSPFECIESDYYFNAAIKKTPSMEDAFMASMKKQNGFD